MYCPDGFVDSYNSTGNIKDRQWRTKINKANDSSNMVQLKHVHASRQIDNATVLHNTFANYFNREENMPWQWDHVSHTFYETVWIKKYKINFVKTVNFKL